VDEKVESVKLALRQINVAEAARQAGVPESTLRYDLDKLDKALPEVLVNQAPGPKPQQGGAADAREESSQPEKSVTCPECGGQVKKNGCYWVLNWVLMLTMGWQGLQKALIQRWRCKECGHELISSERVRQAEARQAWWHQVNRLIALSRFKLRLSVRLTQILVKFVYAKAVSVGHIERVTWQAGRQAKGALDKLKQCRQAVAQFLLFDETFPKMKERGYSLLIFTHK
jgi:transposase-like protein